MSKNKPNVYVIIYEDSVQCYTNLAKAIRNTPKISYFPIYRALKDSNQTQQFGYKIIKTQLK